MTKMNKMTKSAANTKTVAASQVRSSQTTVEDLEKALADERAPKRRFSNLMFTPPELESR